LAAARDERAALLAAITACLNILIASIVMIAATIGGLNLGLMLAPAAYTAMWMAGLSIVWWRHRRAGMERRFSTSAAFILVMFTAGAFGRLICLVGQTFAMPLIDSQLQGIDVALGLQTLPIILGVASIPMLPDLLWFPYNFGVPIIILSALFFIWTGRGERAWEMCFVFNFCLLITTTSSIFIPAAGPFHYEQYPESLLARLPPGSGTYAIDLLFALRKAHSYTIDPTGLFGVACFPSFHTMMALVAAAAWRGVPRIGPAMLVWQGVAIFATIPIGGHYLIDLVGGLVCWALVQTLWQWLMSATQSGQDQQVIQSLA
jgi:hypothetical protein